MEWGTITVGILKMLLLPVMMRIHVERLDSTAQVFMAFLVSVIIWCVMDIQTATGDLMS
jgi:hypothetical protein